MRMNEFDDDLKFKKRRTSDTVFIIKIVFIILTIFAILSSVLFISKMGSSDSYEIEEKGERYGNSEFIKYQGKISVAIPSGGRYFLNGVDINSFRTLNSGDRTTRIVGLDKNHVYFGNIAIPDLDPNKLEVIGNGYYTDDTTTYFCSPLSEKNKTLRVVSDQTGSPTSAAQLARFIIYLIRTDKYGIWHGVCDGSTSWYEFTKEIMKLSGKTEVEVLPIKSEEYKTKAKRPHYSVLSNEKLHRETEFKIKTWQEALKEYLSQI